MPRVEVSGVRHYDREDGSPLIMSVTETIDVMRDKGLEAWQIRYCVKEQDVTASQRFGQLHADYGTMVHDYLENREEEPAYYDPDPVRKAMRSWQLFTTDVPIKIVKTQLELYGQTPKGPYAGTADLLVEMNGIMTLLEIKTSSALRPRAALQSEAYFRACPEAERVFGLRLGKNRIEYELREPLHDVAWEAFQACQVLSHLWNPWTTESPFFVPMAKPIENSGMYEYA